MKKLLFAVFAFCALHVAAQEQSAYEKEIAKYDKKIAKSDEDIANPKKGIDPKTWVNRAELYLEMYNLPVKDINPGMSQLLVKTILRNERSQSDTAELHGNKYDVLKYPHMNLYFNTSGILIFWDITKPATPDPLFKAYEAYAKAHELDSKSSQTKKIADGLKIISQKMITEAQGAFNLNRPDDNRLNDALRYFEGSLKCTGHQTVNTIDTLIIYNAGLVARMVENNDKAIEYFGKAIEIGYEQDGTTIANYATLIRDKGDSTQAMEILRNGFIKYPKNQEILIGLINGYLASGKNLSEVIPYIKQGQENEPTNAGLYYAEGVVYQNLEDNDKAIACFSKSIELNPNFFAAQYSLGALYYNKAVEIQRDAGKELDDNKYNKMVVEMDAEFEKALPFLVKAHELVPNERSVVESLRSIYYRYREKSPEMKERYYYYMELLKTM